MTATEPVARSSDSHAQKSSPSIISGDLKITGDLQSQGDVHIDGIVEGDINARSVTIGDSARIDGRVSGQRVRICGNLSGGVDAQTVELTRTARVNGDIVHDSLQIEAGAFLEGQLRRREAAKDAGRSNSKVTPFDSGRSEEPAANGAAQSQPTSSSAQQAVN